MPVYLTIDLDCLDPSCFPGTGTPEAGGVSFLQLLDAIRTVAKANIIGADLNELAPMLDASGVSTATACKVLRARPDRAGQGLARVPGLTHFERITIKQPTKEKFAMSKVLIIGCGGVASVAIHKCCQVPEVFTEICIASRTKSKCDKLAAELAPKTTTKITTAQVDADQTEEVIALIKAYQPDLVMNIALPYQDLTIMDACLACGVNYMDTANYEPEDTDDPGVARHL